MRSMLAKLPHIADLRRTRRSKRRKGPTTARAHKYLPKPAHTRPPTPRVRTHLPMPRARMPRLTLQRALQQCRLQRRQLAPLWPAHRNGRLRRHRATPASAAASVDAAVAWEGAPTTSRQHGAHVGEDFFVNKERQHNQRQPTKNIQYMYQRFRQVASFMMDFARVAEWSKAQDLGSCHESGAGSNPVPGTYVYR